MGILGPLLSAGTSLIGGLLGKSSADKAANEQKMLAKNSVQLRVRDAQKAGIHPLAALGAPTMSFQANMANPLGDAIQNMGQSLAPALERTNTQEQSVAKAYADQMAKLQLQRAGLENDLLRSQISQINTPHPPMPPSDGGYNVPGQAQSGKLVSNQPLPVTATMPGGVSEPASIGDVGYIRTRTGWMPAMSKDAKERLEEDTIGTGLWNLRNRIQPSLSFNASSFAPPPHVKLKNGEYWHYSIEDQEYQIRHRSYLPENPPHRYDAMGN